MNSGTGKKIEDYRDRLKKHLDKLMFGYSQQDEDWKIGHIDGLKLCLRMFEDIFPPFCECILCGKEGHFKGRICNDCAPIAVSRVTAAISSGIPENEILNMPEYYRIYGEYDHSVYPRMEPDRFERRSNDRH